MGLCDVEVFPEADFWDEMMGVPLLGGAVGAATFFRTIALPYL